MTQMKPRTRGLMIMKGSLDGMPGKACEFNPPRQIDSERFSTTAKELLPLQAFQINVRLSANRAAQLEKEGASVDPGVAKFQLLEMAAGEVDLLAGEAIGLHAGSGAAQDGDPGPMAAVEVQPVPLAVAEPAAAEPAVPQLGLRKDAAGEDAVGERDALEVAAGEVATREAAGTPHRLPEGRGREAAAIESGIDKLGQVEIEAGIGKAVGLPDQAGGGTSRAFAPEVVVGDDFLGTHDGREDSGASSWHEQIVGRSHDARSIVHRLPQHIG